MNNKVTTGKKDVSGKPIIGGFEGIRETEMGSLIRFYKNEDKTYQVAEFNHYDFVSLKLKVRKFKGEQDTQDFQVLNIEGVDKNGVNVEVNLFAEKETPITIIGD